MARPKLRDIISTFRPDVKASRQRVVDPHTGEIKALWGLIGIRLRTPSDDFPDDEPDEPDPTPDPVDPVTPNTGSTPKADSDATRSGDPVDSPKSDLHREKASTADGVIEKEFVQKHRITGSALPESVQEADNGAAQRADPVRDPAIRSAGRPDRGKP